MFSFFQIELEAHLMKSTRTKSVCLSHLLIVMCITFWLWLLIKTLWSCGKSRRQVKTPPSRRAAGTRPAPGGTGARGSWGGRRIPRHHLSPHRSRPRASCRYHKPMGSHQSTPPSAHRSPASRTASPSTHYRRPANTSKAQCTRCRFTLPTLVLWKVLEIPPKDKKYMCRISL